MITEEKNNDFDWDVLDNDTARRRRIPNAQIFEKYKDTVYNHQDYALGYYEELIKSTITNKELEVGNAYKIINVAFISNKELTVLLNGRVECLIDLNNERSFVYSLGFDSIESFTDYISTPDGIQDFINQEYYVVVEQYKPHNRGSITKGQILKMKDEFYGQINKPTSAYYGTILEKNRGGFLIDVQGVIGFLPGSLAATNIVRDFDEMVGKKLPLMVEDYLRDSDTFVFSYKKYVKNILPQKIDELDTQEKYVGTVTGVMKFGIFIEFNEFFTGLLHTSKMSDECKSRFKNGEIKTGDFVNIWIQEIAADKKIILTDIDPAIRRQELEEFCKNNIGINKIGEVLSVKPFVTLVKLEKDIVGMISQKEMRSKKMSLNVGDSVSVSITQFGENNKIFLAINEN
jgi:ribosomal protein S1